MMKVILATVIVVSVSAGAALAGSSAVTKISKADVSKPQPTQTVIVRRGGGWR